MNIQTILIVISTLLAMSSPIVYARAIIKGEAKPHRTTRLVLFLFTILATISLFAKGDRVAIWLAGVSALQASFTFLLSLKYGVGGHSKVDIVCLIMAVFGIILWQTTKEASFALMFAIAADFIGMVPTLVKTYKYPQSEIALFWLIDTCAGTLNLLAVKSWNLSQFIYPLYIALINFAVFILVIRNNNIRHD
jgi:hypothetical protein